VRANKERQTETETKRVKRDFKMEFLASVQPVTSQEGEGEEEELRRVSLQ
jgi:hypothetical protein